jgi:hypothetical protein
MMDEKQHPKIVEAERIGAGLLILFDDGAQAIYPAELLYQLLYVANKMTQEEPEDQPS